MFTPKNFPCQVCGTTITIWTPGSDENCPRCGQWHNSSGQPVRFPLYDGPCAPAGFDPMDAGERWDYDD